MADRNDARSSSHGRALPRAGRAAGVGLDASSRSDDEPEPPSSGFSLATRQDPDARPAVVNATATPTASRTATTDSLSSSGTSSSRSSLSIEPSSKPVKASTAGATVTTVNVAPANDAATNDKPSTDLGRQWHLISCKQAVELLETNVDKGLAPNAAKERLDRDGPNTIREAKGASVWSIFVRQIANALTVILLAALALSFGVQDWIEGGVVAAVIAVNVIIGFVQEYKAEKTMSSLRTLSSPTATVLRGGATVTVPSRDVVVGDIVLFTVGDLLPADVRLLPPLTNLEVDEAPLTGESLPVAKITDALDRRNGTNLGPADRINLAYAGTVVTKGRGRGVVTDIGMTTQIGQIAEAMNKKPTRDADKHLPWYRRLWEPCARSLGLRTGTPLQQKMSLFALVLLGLAIVAALIVFSVAEFDLTDDVILYAIALGIGVLPESLVAVLTITFSVGAKRMANNNVIVRRLDALEAFGNVTDIFSDKTGTLTLGKMVVRKCWVPNDDATYGVEQISSNAVEPVGGLYAVDGQGDADSKAIIDNGQLPAPVARLATAASLCNVAELSHSEQNEWSARGDPTEIALQVFAHKLSLGRPSLTSERFTLVQEHPFDSTTKRMTSIYSDAHDASSLALLTKGGVEQVLACCTDVAGVGPLDEATRTSIISRMESLASEGLRVLAFAERRVNVADITDFSEKPAKSDGDNTGKPQMTRDDAERNSTFIGLTGLYDPPRQETRGSVEACQAAGIVVHMATGDHIATARAIAREVGILDGSEGPSAVMAASDFDRLTDAEVDALDALPLVVARCSPTTKVRLIHAGRRRGRFLAMTGDGVNDAPALRQAPIGIAMGSGTDVAKEASELVLTDDKFTSIATAVREGRTVFANIQRFMVSLIFLNVSEVLLLLIGLALRDSEDESLFPIGALAVLVLNLICGLPAIGLAFERSTPEIMERPPSTGGVFSRQVIVDVFVYGVASGVLSLAVLFATLYGIGSGNLGIDCNEGGNGCGDIFEARSATYAALFLQGLILPVMMLSVERSIFAIGPVKRLLANPFLLASTIGGLIVIPLTIYVSTLNSVVFRQDPMSGAAWGAVAAATALFIGTVELWKWLARRGRWSWLTRVSGGDVRMRRRADHAEVA